MTAEWARVLTVLTNGGLAIVGGIAGAYVVRFIIRRVAPRQDAVFGAFCFMIAALAMRGDIDQDAPRHAVRVGQAIGYLVALPIIWWLWFRREPRRAAESGETSAAA